jgi:branched-chain amino acid transport system ATP-binding protein
MSSPLLRVRNVSKHFGGFAALNGVSFDIGSGERFGIIGPNGSGKTTLINCISGAFQQSGGALFFDGDDISRRPAHKRVRRGIARSFQIPRPFGSMTVIQNLLVPIGFAQSSGIRSSADQRTEAMAILDKIGLGERANALSSELSQVDLRKLELARALAARPKLLISDEAMAGLAGSEIDVILELLFEVNRDGIAIIMIEHIMHAVMRFSQRIICLDAGTVICEGVPEEVTRNKRVQEAYLGA